MSSSFCKLKSATVVTARNSVPTISVVTILLLGASAPAQPESIGVNFFQKTAVDSTSNPGVMPGDNWNNVSTAVGTTQNLHDDSRDTYDSRRDGSVGTQLGWF